MNADRKLDKLSAAKRELLARRISGAAAAPAASSPRRPAGADAPASSAQARLYFLDRLYPDSAAYNMQTALRLRGSLDAAALHHALGAVVSRHESLRTTFAMRDGQLYQVVQPDHAPTLERESTAAAQLEARLVESANRPFNLAAGPLFRASLFQLDADDHALLIVVHHIVSDEWSTGVLLHELATLYAAATGDSAAPRALPAQYGDYAYWQRERLPEICGAQLPYWRGQLANLEEHIDLPADRPRPTRQTFRGRLRRRKLPASVARGVESLAQKSGATPFMTLLGAFQALLYRYSGQADVAVGTPVANRSPAETEELIGLFLNTVIVRSRVSGAASFATLHGQVQANALDAYAHQELPFEELVAELHPERDLSHNPLFQVMLVMETAAAPADAFRGLRAERIELDAGHAKLDLTFFVRLESDGLHTAAEYSTDLFDAATIDRLLQAYEVLLTAALADPEQPVDALPLLPESAAAALARRGAGAPGDADRGLLVPERFLASVAENAKAEAVIDSGQRLGYAALDKRAAAIASALGRRGVGPGALVPVLVERGADQIAAILAVLKVGAAYVPVDPEYPLARRAAVLDDVERESAGELCVVTHSSLRDEVGTGRMAVCIDEPLESGELATGPSSPADPAYVIYTSGSTGRPKGVLITNGNLAASNCARLDYYPAPPRRFLLVSSFAFDSSVVGIYWTLTTGGALHLASREAAADPRLLAALIERERITHTLMLPRLYELLLQTASAEQLASLETVIVAGEPCSAELVWRHVGGVPNARLYNEYGPTEATVWATVYECGGDEHGGVPIGRPIPGYEALVLDANLRLVPDGVSGELCLGGPGVSPGYLGRAKLTAERFPAHPGDAARRLYRTGDRVRWRSDGQLEFLGRLDEQIKLRGFRIEPGEIEARLRELEDVTDAAVVAIERAPGDLLLVAYVSGATGRQPAADALRERLLRSLPDYMVPARFVVMDALPRSPNGKLDRARLPAPVQAPSAAEVAGRADETTAALGAIWQNLLGVPAVGPNADFFALGGHSLNGVSLMLEIERRFGLELPLAALFEAPTLSALAARIRNARDARDAQLLIPIRVGGNATPLFCIHGGARVLARHLDLDQPVYLLFQQLGDLDPESNSVEQMAERYLAEVRRVQPRGPYRFLGFSTGAQIAIEMAQRLRAAAERVELLALCEPPLPDRGVFYKQRLKTHLRAVRAASTRPGRAWAVLREAFGVALRRAARLRLRWQDTYFNSTRRSRGGLFRAGLIAAVAGGVAWCISGVLTNLPDWRPLEAPLALAPGGSVEAEFVASRSGTHEIQLEVQRALPDDQLRRTVLALRERSPVDVRWEISTADGVLAAGGTEDYSYLQYGPRSVLGRLKLILLRIPFGQSDGYFYSFGLLGNTVAARGVGNFEAVEGSRYTLRATTGAGVEALAAGRPSMVVRGDRRSFERHLAKTALIAYAGWALLTLGLLLLAVAVLRERQSVPAELVKYRVMRHNRRISARYRYRRFDGDVLLFLPETQRGHLAQTEAVWRPYFGGRFDMQIVAAAEKHGDLVRDAGGAELAAHLARRFAARGCGSIEEQQVQVEEASA